ncbi:MAG: anthranilate phosphoribosyltransferase [Gammaproteobacteria bacterium]|jgi:anthranilate phosphoribosyltransferase|nr:anthranilate phosphoribosyltransferase [Gammaproteobacteria bacterium]MBT3489577.1 anthranilate phosphoribosyltransferase [Gammaproteobacteria bacterium]MBT3718056.1 anthranilate phosphoribosyltransferase [Gammaproteobacteria bacterium]MBT3844338.1 anthranilate phosphoribosyltransferase [Gammaproteobacteria bacterium]MBT3892395.1 anthranilate phosphoribosyltransferase [Gammaproteobacteria bacterium]
MEIQAAIQAVIEQRDLSRNEMQSVMRTIMTGEATQAQIGGFLIGLRMKGETVDEIAAAASVMRELAAPVKVSGDHMVDCCGTGGDGAKTFNISTASTFVIAAAGGQVAKHGNRSISSSSGSADLLEAAGVKLDLAPDQVANCIDEVGVGFMFAPMHHSAMKHAIGPRKEMAVRTVFNLLGPLTNPAGAPNQVIGVFDGAWVEPLAQVLKQLGSRHVMVVHGSDGLDEITISGETQVAELKDGKVTTYSIKPEQFGLAAASLDTLSVNNAEESLQVVKGVLENQSGAAADIVALNAGAAIYVAGLAETLEAGVKRAQEVISSGEARSKLDALVACSQS